MKTKKTFWSALTCVGLTWAAFAAPKTMYNYVAYDAAFWPKELPVTAENYAKHALNGLENRPFDTLVFAPMFGFGSMAAKLSSAEIPTVQPASDSKWLARWKNAMPALIKAGVDPLAETVKWCRKYKRSAVVALPVNLLGAHSAQPTSKTPAGAWGNYLWPAFKTQNADALMGTAVDYTSAKVRDKFSAIACEIAGKYDIDGIMVDFMNSPYLFKSVREAGVAAPKEVELITQMMTKIKAACKSASTRLGHPVLFSARVPDSVGYCKDMGINLQNWFDTKLLDYVVLGGQFQLNPWNVTGGLALKAGVPFYVSFTTSGIYVGNDSGYSGDDERLPRQSAATMNARIADALLAKASGCMYTMGMHHEHTIPGGAVVPFDEKANRLADKRYFVSYTNDRTAEQALKGGLKHRTVDSLLSGAPENLAKGISKHRIFVWEDFAALKKDGVTPKVVLATEVMIPSGMDTIVAINGKELKSFRRRAGVQYYEVPLQTMKTGANEVTVKAKGKNKRGQTAAIGNVAVEITYPKADAKKEAGK